MNDMNFNIKSLGKRIKKVRGKKKASVLAPEIGITRTALNYYECGKRCPNAETIYNICKNCGVSADYLLNFPAIEKNFDFGKAAKITNIPEETLLDLSAIYEKIKLLGDKGENIIGMLNCSINAVKYAIDFIDSMGEQ